MPLQISLETTQPIELIDLTPQIRTLVEKDYRHYPLLQVASLHTTCAVVVNERCEDLQSDMVDFLKQLAPAGHPNYRHDKIAIDGQKNTHSHLLSLLLPTQQTLSITEGKLHLGPWQSIFLVELDGPRKTRKVQLHFIQF